MREINSWAVVPAAGVGRRMGSGIPKQYLPLSGRTVLEWTLETLLNCPRIQGVYVAISPDDQWWHDLPVCTDTRVVSVNGGKERCHSVLNALQSLQNKANHDDMVLVHDAARPCLRMEDLERLIDTSCNSQGGGLLGVPVRDTMKRTSDSGKIVKTVPRDYLWHAYTPQMFRLDILHQAMEQALKSGQTVTDEASAMELAGFSPMLVEGHDDNIKITRPEDLVLAEFYLKQQGRL